MSLLDTIDGSFMNFAYGWAFSQPVRKVYYNITITGLSALVALGVGTIELAGIFAGGGPDMSARRLRDRRHVRRHMGGVARGVALRPHRGALERRSRHAGIVSPRR